MGAQHIVETVDKGVRGAASPGDSAWLRTNEWTIIWWFVALQYMQDALEKDVRAQQAGLERLDQRSEEFARRKRVFDTKRGLLNHKLETIKTRSKIIRQLVAKADPSLAGKSTRDLLQHLLKNRNEWKDLVQLEDKLKRWAREQHRTSF